MFFYLKRFVDCKVMHFCKVYAKVSWNEMHIQLFKDHMDQWLTTPII